MLTTLLIAVTLAQPKPELIDAAAFRDKLLVLTDGKNHYVAVDPDAPYGETTFTSGDGKVFTRIPVAGGGKNGTEQWSVSVWDPRVRHGGNSPASIEMQDSGKSYSVTCAKKVTPMTRVPAEEAKKLLAAATFNGPTWTRIPEKLLRDDTGVYYLVDRFRSRDAADRRDFRVFSGQKGNMKQLPLKDVVDDAQGMILSTKTGNLRLITTTDGKFEGKWIQGKTTTLLVEVPLDDYNTGRMVYMDLGPYSGQRLGTPCDDLM
ncbi:MAG: hypothetical protein Q8K32_17315 [Archangium sp.]|nr:hypothetical protein [Archangium sp.]